MDVENSLKKIKVLLVDDDEDDYILIRRLFRQITTTKYEIEWVNTYEAALERIEAREHNVYLIDYFLGEESGLDLLEATEADKRAEPFILLTGAGNKELEQRAVDLAASDYLVKGSFNAELLSRTVLYAIGRKQTEQQRIEHLMELGRSKDEFISIASHQLRTPATAVKQYLGMLLQGFMGEVTDEQLIIVQKAYNSNERQLRIVADLLKVAQVDSGTVRLRKTEVDINKLIGDVIRELQDTYTQRKQSIEFLACNESTISFIDTDAMRMVFENIIDNASKYSMPDTTVTVNVTSPSPHVVQVSIKDQGVGISREDEGRLFEKFFRIENPLSTKVGGTGLGLYWAKKIIDLHEGSIDYKSVIGKGTEFIITLPKNEKK